MSKVIEIEIDDSIDLGDATYGMPDNVKGSLLAALTMTAKKRNCRWTDLKWSVDKCGVIKVGVK